MRHLQQAAVLGPRAAQVGVQLLVDVLQAGRHRRALGHRERQPHRLARVVVRVCGRHVHRFEAWPAVMLCLLVAHRHRCASRGFADVDAKGQEVLTGMPCCTLAEDDHLHRVKPGAVHGPARGDAEGRGRALDRPDEDVSHAEHTGCHLLGTPEDHLWRRIHRVCLPLSVHEFLQLIEVWLVELWAHVLQPAGLDQQVAKLGPLVSGLCCCDRSLRRLKIPALCGMLRAHLPEHSSQRQHTA